MSQHNSPHERRIRRLSFRRRSPFRTDYPVPAEACRPDPGPDWSCPMWQAYVTRGKTAAIRTSRLREAPRHYRRYIISHVNTAFRIQK